MRQYFSYEKISIFAIACGFNWLYTCIRDIQNCLEKFFHKHKDHGKCDNSDVFWKSYFFIIMIHVGEVFEVMKNTHQAKKGSRERGGIQIVSATDQEWCILKFLSGLQKKSRVRELKITKISNIYVKLFILEVFSIMYKISYIVHLLDQFLRIRKQRNAFYGSLKHFVDVYYIALKFAKKKLIINSFPHSNSNGS